MSDLINAIANVSFRDPVLWVALGSSVVVVFAFLVLSRRKRGGPVPIASTGGSAPSLSVGDEAWQAPKLQASERRRSARRGGVPTPVQVVDPKKKSRTMEAFVLDRSTGGLRIAISRPFPTGTILHVRPANAPSEVTWVLVIVRNCRETGDYYELGCQFEQELPWGQLLLFG